MPFWRVDPPGGSGFESREFNSHSGALIYAGGCPPHTRIIGPCRTPGGVGPEATGDTALKPAPGFIPTSWTVGRNFREDFREQDEGKYEVRLTFDDLEHAKAWAAWLAQTL